MKWDTGILIDDGCATVVVSVCALDWKGLAQRFLLLLFSLIPGHVADVGDKDVLVDFSGAGNILPLLFPVLHGLPSFLPCLCRH